MTKKWAKVNNLSSGQYFVNKNIRFKTLMLRSNLCDYSGAYIVVKGRVTVRAMLNRLCGLRSCIRKSDGKLIYNAEDI